MTVPAIRLKMELISTMHAPRLVLWAGFALPVLLALEVLKADAVLDAGMV